MDMSGEQRIPAPQQQVWDALYDPEVLKLCIPGCESVEKTSETEFTAKVVLAVGPVKAKFAGDVSLLDIDAPNSCTISGKGNGGIAGFGKGSAKVVLKTEGDETVLTYTASASVGGKIAQIGARLVDSTAKKLADEFFKRFVAHMTEKGAPGRA
jgi:carbon monoxide dehydrogenase subunit G